MFSAVLGTAIQVSWDTLVSLQLSLSSYLSKYAHLQSFSRSCNAGSGALKAGIAQSVTECLFVISIYYQYSSCGAARVKISLKNPVLKYWLWVQSGPRVVVPPTETVGARAGRAAAGRDQASSHTSPGQHQPPRTLGDTTEHWANRRSHQPGAAPAAPHTGRHHYCTLGQQTVTPVLFFVSLLFHLFFLLLLFCPFFAFASFPLLIFHYLFSLIYFPMLLFCCSLFPFFCNFFSISSFKSLLFCCFFSITFTHFLFRVLQAGRHYWWSGGHHATLAWKVKHQSNHLWNSTRVRLRYSWKWTPMFHEVLGQWKKTRITFQYYSAQYNPAKKGYPG